MTRRVALATTLGWIAGTVLTLVAGAPAHAQGERSATRFPEVDRLGRDLQPIVKQTQRNEILQKSRGAMTRPMEVTSTDRIKPPSAAHNHGAIDIRSNNISSAHRHEEARAISKNVGPSGRVVVEEVHRPGRGQAGPSAQIDTTYQNGAKGSARAHDIKATGTHTHVQPNQGIGWRAKGAR
jgi:hypothetical protein